jgi:exonuclease III
MLVNTDREEHKLQTLINHESDIVIVIDHHLDTNKLASLTKNNRQIFSKYTIYGTPSLKRGILILVKKCCGCKLANVKSLANNDILSFDIILPDMTIIKTCAIYAPSKDTPLFWDAVHEEINKGDTINKVILGDFNVTLDHKIDSSGYKTDPHPKSRTVINNWLENETYVDVYRHYNPETPSYTFRTKDCKKKSRLDYCLSSPNLIPFINNITHLAHNHLNADHSSIIIDLDFTNTTQGKGIFRCPPNAHKDKHYMKLIKNSIKRAIYTCIESAPGTELEIGLLEARIKLEEELSSLQNKTPHWNTQNRQNTLQHTIGHLLSNEPTNETLIERPLTIDKPNLLEFILLKIKEDTIIYSKRTKHTHITQDTELKQTLQELISEPESDTNTILIHDTQQQIEELETKLLYDNL